MALFLAEVFKGKTNPFAHNIINDVSPDQFVIYALPVDDITAVEDVCYATHIAEGTMTGTSFTPGALITYNSGEQYYVGETVSKIKEYITTRKSKPAALLGTAFQFRFQDADREYPTVPAAVPTTGIKKVTPLREERFPGKENKDVFGSRVTYASGEDFMTCKSVVEVQAIVNEVEGAPYSFPCKILSPQ